jgi:hypothetical protein
MTMFDMKQKFETPDWFVKVLPLFGLFVQDRIKKENASLLARIGCWAAWYQSHSTGTQC